MSDTNPIADNPAPQLSDAAVASARQIADWCERQRVIAETAAKGQIRVVWMLLLGGLILLLILPRVIQEIDFAGRKDSLPPEALKTAQATIASVESNREEMEKEVEAATAVLEKSERQLQQSKDEFADLERQFRELTEPDFAVWRIVTPDTLGTDFVLSTVHVTENGILAAGDTRSDKTLGPAILHSVDGLSWTRLENDLDELHGTSINALTSDGSGMIVAALSSEIDTAIYASPDAVNWGEAWWSGFPGRRDGVYAIAAAPDGSFLAAGKSHTNLETPQLLIQTTDGTWQSVTGGSGFVAADGNLESVVPLSGGGLMVAGYESKLEGNAILVTYFTRNGQDWEKSHPVVNGQPVDGSVNGLSQAGDGALYLAYLDWDNSDVLRSKDGMIWNELGLEVNELPGGITFTAVQGLSDGGAVAAARATASETELTLTMAVSGDGENGWEKTRYESIGKVFDHDIHAMAELPDGRIVAVGDRAILISLLPSEAGALDGDAMTAVNEPNRLLLPDGASTLALGQKRRIDQQSQLNDLIAQQREFVATTKASYDRQNDAATEIRQLTTELEKSLRANEPFRQIAQTATRLAVIGLLIYLVQIVVNRYRYLQRLAGFYQARAQALEMFAASPEADLLKGVSLADLTAMLSPDAIGFDKSAEPPTSQMVSLLQAGLRKA